MTSSGMKRGLAATAVSALAMAGLPFMATSAHADSLASQEAASDVVLHVPDGAASVKNDGVNTTVHLLANGGVDVIQVQFRYSTDGGTTWTNIGAPVSRTNGAFSTEWTPPTAFYNLPVLVQAQALGNVGTEIDSDTNTVTPSSNVESIDIANAPGSAIGVYLDEDGDELGAINGTTSDVTAAPDLNFWSPSGTGGVTQEDVAGEPSGGVRTYSAPVDFAGYSWDTDPAGGLVNEAIVIGEADGDDAEAVTLYQQEISSVTATAEPASPQSGADSIVTVTVLDQNGKPVVGANVHQESPAVEKETNSQGQATFAVQDTNASGGTTYAYFVDENDNDTHEPGSEFRRTVTVTDYTPTATQITGASRDGAAWDFDEYETDNTDTGDGDITVTVKDQNGANLKGQSGNLAGKFTITPFDGTAVQTRNATFSDDDNDGVYDVAIVGGYVIEGDYVLNVWMERDGTPGETAGDLSMAPVSFAAGQAEIVWADEAEAQRQAGTTGVFEATMELADGTALPGRNVAITWSPTGNAVMAAEASQPGATDRTSNTTATSTTGNDGSFAVAISDPAASPNVDELNGSLDAVGTDTPPIGNSAAPADALDVDFLADPAVSTTTSTATLDALDAGNVQSPGRPVAVNLVIKNADGTLLTDVPVSATTDHGFFTTPDATNLSELKPDPAAAEGANYGEWENLGTTTTTETDDDGEARVVVAIERDAGFDDDGLVTAKVTFTVGGKTITKDIVFDSSNPMNPGTVSIELAPDAMQTVTILPKAPTTERVAFYAKATDQYGNLTDVTLNLSDNTPLATVENVVGTEITTITSQFTNAAPGVYGDGSAPTSQVITGLWDNAPTLTWTDAQTPLPAGFQEETVGGVDGTKVGSKDVSDDSPAIEWYDIDYAKSVYTLDQEGAEENTVGTAVTEVYTAIDQMGEPISDLDVVFFRAGPDDEQDGDGNSGDDTNSDGVATYTFQGESVGTARITAVPYLNGDRIAAGEATDTVSFVRDQVRIDALLKLGNQRDGDDVARVNAPAKAAGATVRLYKVKKNGDRVLLATKTANARGNAKFVVNDRNGNRFTKYQAKVGKTARTFADWTPRKSVR